MKFHKGKLLAGIVLMAMGALVLVVHPLPWNLRGVIYIGLGIYIILDSK